MPKTSLKSQQAITDGASSILEVQAIKEYKLKPEHLRCILPINGGARGKEILKYNLADVKELARKVNAGEPLVSVGDIGDNNPTASTSTPVGSSVTDAAVSVENEDKAGLGDETIDEYGDEEDAEGEDEYDDEHDEEYQGNYDYDDDDYDYEVGEFDGMSREAAAEKLFALTGILDSAALGLYDD